MISFKWRTAKQTGYHKEPWKTWFTSHSWSNGWTLSMGALKIIVKRG